MINSNVDYFENCDYKKNCEKLNSKINRFFEKVRGRSVK